MLISKPRRSPLTMQAEATRIAAATSQPASPIASFGGLGTHSTAISTVNSPHRTDPRRWVFSMSAPAYGSGPGAKKLRTELRRACMRHSFTGVIAPAQRRP